ncbi:FAD-binding oxidoreductase [Maledivibacter halophilus]|uniref:D-lactate dehydrogenase (cytochrome) n=1 Tax=Maledivibacter halophilus TaxID=36842 RepID=A0A1T5L2Y4_9FIRM|nr:FAD-binding oxidoreductase [Maledivibacter halophilus]SKC70416.1 D-lactate dehydrogenase (cytochrome) [Maledivibacter halophilus]
MKKNIIKPMNEEFNEYLRDESRTIGNAQSISFPKNEEEVIEILTDLYSKGIQITIQGGRTGLAAGAVPDGGHIMNLSKMNKVLGMDIDKDGYFYLTLQPGTILSKLRKQIESKKFDRANWNDESMKTFTRFCEAPEQFFTPDPTEASATIGGMVACNASGARSYLYGPTRKHITALKVVLCNGQTLSVRRGETFANRRLLKLTTDQGDDLSINLPSFNMPKTKNASGYYIKDNMDAIDLFIGSDGTLGVVTEIEVKLLPLPEAIWGVSCFFTNENNAIEFVMAIREQLKNVASIEFFDGDALTILRNQKEQNPAFSRLPVVDEKMNTAIYVEIHCENEEKVIQELISIGGLMKEIGGDETDTWVARNDADRSLLLFFRHAVPESVNMLIDERKKTEPIITKLGTDMSVPDKSLKHIMQVYRHSLDEYELQSAIWGHIGDNHLHVNILPRNEEDFKKGKELYAKWANEVTKLGGAVSAEHGVGKLKASFLTVMYGQEHIDEMAKLKSIFDPKALLGAGNMFVPKKGDELTCA